MKKQSALRKHNFPDADLYMTCMECIRYAHRDLAAFETYGYGMDRLKAFQARCEQFRALPDDEELLGAQMVLTEKKYQAAERLQATIRSVMTRVATKYNNRSGRYRKFGATRLGDMTDAQLIFCARRVVRVARQQLDFLAETGLNEHLLGRISEAAQAFESAVNLQQDRVADRDIGVERRIAQGNALYEELVVVCDIGKDIWDNKDIRKYEQFCLYESNNEQKKARKAGLRAPSEPQ